MFSSNQASAVATHGPIAYWGVSSITDMAELFKDMTSINADISGWNTSSVTTMRSMFEARAARASTPNWIHPERFLTASRLTLLPSPGPRSPTPNPKHHRGRRRSTSR
eukprot:scaffold16009_cov32-Phaeocystis_antarctica.AAC.2